MRRLCTVSTVRPEASRGTTGPVPAGRSDTDRVPLRDQRREALFPFRRQAIGRARAVHPVVARIALPAHDQRRRRLGVVDQGVQLPLVVGAREPEAAADCGGSVSGALPPLLPELDSHDVVVSQVRHARWPGPSGPAPWPPLVGFLSRLQGHPCGTPSRPDSGAACAELAEGRVTTRPCATSSRPARHKAALNIRRRLGGR